MSNNRADIVAMAQQFVAGGGIRSIAASAANKGDDLTIPEFLRRSKDEPPAPKPEKRLQWTKDMSFKESGKEEDPSTARFKSELERQAKAEATHKKETAKETRVIRARQRAKPITTNPAEEAITGDEAMSKAKKKLPSTHPAVRGAKKAKSTTRAKTGAKRQARTTARVAKPAGEKKVSRKDEVIAMMKRAGGVTSEQIEKATGMLPHSARALISGIRKDNKVETTKNDDKVTVYKIG